MAKFCPNCGVKLEEGAEFCTSCGRRTYQSIRRDETFQEMFLTTSGRLNRLRYFKRSLVIGIIHAVLFLTIFGAHSDYVGNLNSTGETLTILLGIIFLVPRYCLDVRRLHDMGKDKEIAYLFAAADLISYFSGSYNPDDMPLYLILVGLIILALWLYVLLTPGNIGSNRYGEDLLQKL